MWERCDTTAHTAEDSSNMAMCSAVLPLVSFTDARDKESARLQKRILRLAHLCVDFRAVLEQHRNLVSAVVKRA
jgi:hypothetical protein